MTPTIAAEKAEPKRRFWWHWQNLNDKKDGAQGSGFRHGRCWWHFGGTPRLSKTIQFSWNFWTHFCGVEADIGDEDLTFHVAFPPISFWLSFSTNWWVIAKLAPRRPLQYYPDTTVIDERRCGVTLHGGRAWFYPWSKTNEWVKTDPWWARGVSVSINPFEWTHMRHEVRRPDGSWVPYVGSWEEGRDGKVADGREVLTYSYRYVLKNGTVQDRTAKVFMDRCAWRPRCFQWTSLFEKRRTSIDIEFSDEVGERSGSWKGGCTGCGWDIRPNETPEQALRRMEAERKF